MENKLDINHNEKSSLDSIKLQTKSMVLQNNANKNKKVDGLIRPKITEISNLKFKTKKYADTLTSRSKMPDFSATSSLTQLIKVREHRNKRNSVKVNESYQMSTDAKHEKDHHQEEKGVSAISFIKNHQINFNADFISKKFDAMLKQTKKYTLNEIEFMDDLSKGSFGDDLKDLFLKLYQNSSIINDKHIMHILNEKEILKIYSDEDQKYSSSKGGKLDLTQSKFSSFSTPILLDTLQNEDNIYFLMDFFPGGELGSLFAKQRINMKMDDIRLYLSEVITSLEKLHK